ncbi:hypothetical protein G6F22_021872 [Rhizopus arrhizus]|nr:hypothetical protein G6F22_021872 [Rhizopus arrhizus]KAG0899083.1 hypothetical protein G6F32_017355 [Rhizopus arrhizus]
MVVQGADGVADLQACGVGTLQHIVRHVMQRGQYILAPLDLRQEQRQREGYEQSQYSDRRRQQHRASLVHAPLHPPHFCVG